MKRPPVIKERDSERQSGDVNHGARVLRETMHMTKDAASEEWHQMLYKENKLHWTSLARLLQKETSKQKKPQVCAWKEGSVSRIAAIYYSRCQIFNTKKKLLDL